MKKTLTYIIITIAAIIIAIPLQAQDTIFTTAVGTVQMLIEKDRLPKDFQVKTNFSSDDPFLSGAEVLRLYEEISEVLIKNKILTQKQIDEIKSQSAAADGLKIGGYNLSVMDRLLKESLAVL